MAHLVAKLRKSLRHHGLSGTLKLALLNVYWFARDLHPRRRRHRKMQRQIDETFCIDTCKMLQLYDLQVQGGSARDANAYEPTPPLVLPSVLQKLPLRYEDYSFVDLGSGMGRALFMAMEFPFQRVIGVEFSPVLHDRAKENARSYRSGTRQCKCLELLCMDAARFEIPSEPVVIYMYNPFRGAVMDAVLRNIEDSLQCEPRDLFLIYFNPVLDKEVSQVPGLTRIGSTRFYSIYRSALPVSH